MSAERIRAYLAGAPCDGDPTGARRAEELASWAARFRARAAWPGWAQGWLGRPAKQFRSDR
jgi:hypothetical protein